MPSGNFELFNIQALRAVAAFLVVFVHIDRLAELAGFRAGTTVFGNTGVDLFFVISGFIMVVTVTERPQSPAQFFRHRVARIVPLYWLVTLAVFTLALVAPVLLQSTRANPAELLKSLAFIPYRRFDGQMHPLVFVGWTLNYEMMFYALFAVGMLFSRKAAGFAFTLGTLVLAAIAGQIVGPRGGGARILYQPDHAGVRRRHGAGYLACFEQAAGFARASGHIGKRRLRCDAGGAIALA